MIKKSLNEYSDEELTFIVDYCEADNYEEWLIFLREQQRRESFAELLKGGAR